MAGCLASGKIARCRAGHGHSVARRWNGWGDDTVHAPLSADALAFLAEAVGRSSAPTDASLAAALATVSAQTPRLPPHPLVDTSAAQRLAASSGQSCGDWIALRFGVIGRVCDGVAWPQSAGQVRELLDWARSVGARVLACGGATSVVGHLNPGQDPRPLLALRLGRMNRLLDLDEDALLARFEAGVAGPDLEAQLRQRGFTLGHYPQSFEYSTLGGWIVTRSSGQQSARYGRIEQLFAGGSVETPLGSLTIAPFPASAAGPDLREAVLGSEGRIGVVTEAVVRISRLPGAEAFIGVFLPSWDAARSAARALAQARLGLSMLRLANVAETRTTLRLAAHASAITWLERGLRWRGCGADKCLLMLGLSGEAAQVAAMRRAAAALWRRHGGVSTGRLLGERWRANRFRGVYLRNSAWQAGYAIETMETACNWGAVDGMVNAVEAAGRAALAAEGERCHAYTHLSHLYPQGSSVYATFIFRVAADHAATHARWQRLKAAVSAAIVAHGGTISHQHGVGADHAPYLAAEKGELGMAAIAALLAHFDPDGLLAGGRLNDAH